MADRKTFFLGLNMSGAVSAGAYTAGVMDFLIDALDTWYAERARQQQIYGDDFERWTVPPHDIRLVGMSGASAGGMVSAITSAALCQDFDHVREQNTAATATVNPLFQSWVRDIDAEYLLGGRDLADPDSKLVSLLDSTRIDEIADTAVRVRNPRREKRPWVADGLKVILTLTNLGGIPYAIEGGSGSEETQTLNHADSREFEVRWNGSEPSTKAIVLRPESLENWDQLGAAAKATGAFPVMLAPRFLDRNAGEYNGRKWRLKAASPQCESYDFMPPSWVAADDVPFRTLNVDGGVTNNSPFDCVHNVVAAQEPPPDGQRNERTAALADRAVVSIAPFLSAPRFDISQPPSSGLFGMLGQLMKTLIGQSRIQGENIKFTHDADVFSRWAIAPSIASHADTTSVNALACGSLSAFGGFMAFAFRDHDYQLGRRNCQWFLMKHFGLPFDNAVMGDYYNHVSPDKRNEFAANFGVPLQAGTGMAIIPLIGKTRESVPVTRATLPGYELDKIGALALNRVNLIARQLMQERQAGAMKRLLYKAGWSLFRGRLQDSLVETLRAGLSAENLID